MALLDLGPSCTLVARLVADLPDARLAGPTPCPAYAVADLVEHLDGLALAFTAAARKEPLADADPAPDGGLAGGWRERVPARLAALAAAWTDPAAYAGTTTAGGVEMPGEVTALVALDEVVVHGWDLARALGAPYDPDPAAIAACLDFVGSFDAPADDGGLFGPPVPVRADAPALDRLIGAAGRDPAWTPAADS